MSLGEGTFKGNNDPNESGQENEGKAMIEVQEQSDLEQIGLVSAEYIRGMVQAAIEKVRVRFGWAGVENHLSNQASNIFQTVAVVQQNYQHEHGGREALVAGITQFTYGLVLGTLFVNKQMDLYDWLKAKFPDSFGPSAAATLAPAIATSIATYLVHFAFSSPEQALVSAAPTAALSPFGYAYLQIRYQINKARDLE